MKKKKLKVYKKKVRKKNKKETRNYLSFRYYLTSNANTQLFLMQLIKMFILYCNSYYIKVFSLSSLNNNCTLRNDRSYESKFIKQTHFDDFLL
jgi:hypothetical protein